MRWISARKEGAEIEAERDIFRERKIVAPDMVLMIYAEPLDEVGGPFYRAAL
jgi:hypothetical protein